MSNFKVGDIVKLKSGGPKMTIDNIDLGPMEDTETAWVSWFDNTLNPQSGSYPITSLDIC
ncbi:MAG: DUF2158 domain-containing protein [Robiginitomaculum sp.]|nr:MAG: DUF2158 domain-containing protein [Robiginitomaculum sp.]